MLENIWKNNNLVSLLLRPFSFIYYITNKIYRLVKSEKCCGVPVLCVGNVNLGGAGKTPTVIEIRRLLQNHIKNIFVLTRGYKGKKRGPLIVDKNSKFHDVGDESLLHYKQGPTCVAKNKFDGAKLCKQKGCKLILMDDGLQSNDIIKNFRILVIDSNFDFGNNQIFPAGPLREPIKECIIKSDIVLVIGQKKFLKKYKYISKEKLFTGHRILNVKELKNKNLYVFSALGNNQNFHNSLLNEGLKIIKSKKFPDHYIFKKDEIKKIIYEAKKEDLSVVCTDKDFVKVPNKFKQNIYPVGLKIKIQESKRLKETIIRNLGFLI